MKKKGNIPNVGAPDPELKNSPIFDNPNENDEELRELELESDGCYFNNQRYDIEQYVCSGDELLRCEGRGIWIREGSCYSS